MDRPLRSLAGELSVVLSCVIAINTTNKAGISSMKTTDIGTHVTYLM
jgi:hypothetical protein